MYRITYIHKDETKENSLYIPGDQDYCLTSGTLDLECGKSGQLSVSIPDINPAKEDILCLTDEIIVYRDLEEIWRGRPMTYQMDFDKTGTLICEGVLSYLYDTVYPPFEFQGSPKEFLQSVLDNHNSQVESRKQFVLGDVTVEDNNDYINRSSVYYDKSLNVLTDKLINDSLGGYFRVRIGGDTRYLDYLETYDTQATQMVQYGENLLDIAEEVEYSDLATVILPLGAKLTDAEGIETDEYTTIESVNGGSIYYADEAAVKSYGWIVVIAEWDDVTEPSNLLEKAKDYLMQVTSALSSFTVNAIDLSLISGEEPIRLGDYVWILSEPHGINQYIELTEQHIDILYPENDVLSFGVNTATLTESQKATERVIETAMNSVEQHFTRLTVDAFDALYANIEVLSVDTANIISLLAGEIGTGILQSIHLTTDNVVIDDAVINDAMIVSVTADKLTAGTIYTDYVKIANNEGQQLWIDGATIQMKDDNDIVRVQIGEDNTGDYNLYLWNAAGDLIWDAQGLCEAGLPVGNEAIIRNDQVAEGAAISGSKLDIDSVSSYLNEYGDLVVNAAHVQIDDTTLDYELTKITNSVEEVAITAGEAVMGSVTEYYQSTSATELDGGEWSTEQPTWTQGMYIWARTTVTYGNGTVVVGNPVCITGNNGADGVIGKDGVGVESTDVEYAASTSGDIAPESGWSDTIPEVNEGDYLWTRTTIHYTNDTDSVIYSVSMAGGVGQKGDDGVGISSVEISYQVSSSGTTEPTGTWSASIPTVSDGQYLWTRTIFHYTDGTSTTMYTISKAGDTGKTGADGESVSITSTSVAYQASSSGTTAPTGTWSTSVPTVAEGQYLWTRTQVTYSDGTTTTSYSVSYVAIDGKDGSDGSDGRGISSTAISYASSSSGTSAPSSWSSSIPSVSAGNYLWTRVVITYSDNTTTTYYSVAKAGETGAAGKDGSDGDDGRGIESSATTYQVSASGTSVPTGTWSSSIPAVSEGEYLWTRIVFTYTDGTTSEAYSVSKAGEDGKDGSNGNDGVGVTSTVVSYQASSSGTTAPTGTWSSSIPTVTEGEYLWTRIVFNYSDGSSSTVYSVSKDGTNGANGEDGKGIESYQISYGVGTSATTPPNTWHISDSGNPNETTKPGEYLWTRIVFTYTDRSTSTFYSVSYHAEDGEDGTPGADGNGIESYEVTYQVSTSGTTRPTGTWSTDIPEVPEGEYLWTRIEFTYTDGSSSTAYTVSRSGEDGADGEAGVGIESYDVYYGTSTSGTTAPSSWGNSIPTVAEGSYLWTRTRIYYSDGSSSTSYSVSYQGVDGEQGEDGVGVESYEVSYATSASGTDAPTSGWSNVIPEVDEGNYLWTRTILHMTNGESVTMYSVAMAGESGEDGVGIESSETTYQAGTSGTTPPTGTWTTDIPSVPDGQYLWTKTIIYYTDGTSATAYSVSRDGTDGDDGLGIYYTSIEYATSTSGTSAPMNGWQVAVPTVTEGEYLWTRTTIFYTDGSSSMSYSVSYHAYDGENGNGIDSYEITYQAGTSGTTPPSGTWSTSIPEVAEGEFLWTKTVLYYTNGTSSTVYSVAKNGESGKGVDSIECYYAVGTAEKPPSNPPSDDWTTTPPDLGDDGYLWACYHVTYTDDTDSWTEQFLLSDTITRTHMETLQTELETVEGQITAKVWQTDIDSAVDELNNTIDSVEDQFGVLQVQVDSITATVGDVQTTVQTITDDVTGVQTTITSMSSEISNISQTINEITLSVSDVQQTITEYGSSIDALQAELDSIDTNGLVNIEQYFCVSDSSTTAPADNANWTTGDVVSGENQYVWEKILLTYQDGHTVWTNAYCLTDSYVRSEISSAWASIDILDDRITQEVADVKSIVDGDYEYLSAWISEIETTSNSISLRVTATEGEISDLQTTAASLQVAIDEITPDLIISYINASADVIYLNGYRLIIDTDKFTLDSSGTLRSISTNYMSEMSGGYFNLYYQGTLYGRFRTSVWQGTGTANSIGLAITMESLTGNYIMFGSREDEEQMYYGSYIINYGLNPDGYEERHIFRGTMRFINTVYTDLGIYAGAGIRIPNTSYYYCYNTSGSEVGLVRMSDENLAQFGSTSYETRIRGTAISLRAAVTTTSSVTTGASIYIPNGSYLYWKNTSGTNVDLLIFGASNALRVGNTSYELRLRGSSIDVSGDLTSSNSITIDTSNGTCALYANSSYVGLYTKTRSNFLCCLRKSDNSTILGFADYDTRLYGENIYLRGTSTAVTSDRKLKSDIKQLDKVEDALITNITPRSYTVNDHSDGVHFGFVVDELEEAMRDAGLDPDEYGLTAHFDDDETGENLGAIRYDEFIPLLVYEIQQLKSDIAALKQ